MKVLLVSTYELGHQPVHLAAPAAALRARGHTVRAIDVAVDKWAPELAEWADRVAFSVPMHTATRLARKIAASVDRPTCFYGLYAASGPERARRIAGEYVTDLCAWVDEGGSGLTTSLGREPAVQPSRESLPPVARYAHLIVDGDERLAGAVEASRGCAHRCRHCPVPVVYDGRVRVVDEQVVLADIAALVDAGVRHVTFADPDFLNAPHHARRVVEAMHDAFPDLTFDCTVKVEHILRHRNLWPQFRAGGCLFVVSAFESATDAILVRLDKGHSIADATETVTVLRGEGIEVRPSFLPFTPWTTRADVHAILDFVAAHGLVGNVDAVQYTIRLLLPPGSLLLDDVAVDGYDPEHLTSTWRAADPQMDALQVQLTDLVEHSDGEPPAYVYQRIRHATGAPTASSGHVVDAPRLSESWFCCAEPTARQAVRFRPPSNAARPEFERPRP